MLCDRVVVLNRGRLIALDTPGALVAQVGGVCGGNPQQRAAAVSAGPGQG